MPGLRLVTVALLKWQDKRGLLQRALLCKKLLIKPHLSEHRSISMELWMKGPSQVVPMVRNPPARPSLVAWWSEAAQCVPLFATSWTVAYQSPLSMGFSRKEYWSGLPFPSLGDLPDPGIERRFPTLQADALLSEPPGWLNGGKEFSCQHRRHGFDPWCRKIPHAAEQLSPLATAIEPVLWSPGGTTTEPMCPNYWSPCALETVLRNKRIHYNKKPPSTATREEPPLSATREKPLQQQRPSTATQK